MEIINPGNCIPVYKNLASQIHNRCGCEEFDYAIPIQEGFWPNIEFPMTVGNTISSWVLISDQGSSTPLSTGLLSQKTTLDGTRSWLSYYGATFTNPFSGCRTYYFQFTDNRGNTFITERFRFFDFNTAKKVYRLQFWNSTDIDGILYQDGYRQNLWLTDAVFDTPEIIESPEIETDGNAVENVVFQSVQVRDVLRFPYVPDFWQGVLKRLRSHDTVTLTKIKTGEVFTLSGKDVQFETEVQDVCFSKGTLSWLASVQVGTGCEEDYVLA